MSVLVSSLNPKSANFSENTEAYAELTRTLRERQQRVVDGERERSIERHRSRGKYLPRERIDMCVDAGTPFLELSTLAGHGQYDDEVPGGGIVTGIGIVCGTPCVFIANDATVKGGTLLPASINSLHLEATSIVCMNRLACP